MTTTESRCRGGRAAIEQLLGRNNAWMDVEAIATRCRLTKTGAQVNLRALLADGIIERRGAGRADDVHEYRMRILGGAPTSP